MKKTLILALALALVGGVAYANFCARDIVPSASLLVPYIVVDTDASGIPNPNGYTTLTVVTNVSSAKQFIHVTVWSADSEPVVDFDEVLSGYDVWSINWRDLVTGNFNLFDTGSPTTGFWTGTIGTAGDAFGPTSNPLGAGFVGIDDPQDIDYSRQDRLRLPVGQPLRVRGDHPERAADSAGRLDGPGHQLRRSGRDHVHRLAEHGHRFAAVLLRDDRHGVRVQRLLPEPGGVLGLRQR